MNAFEIIRQNAAGHENTFVFHLSKGSFDERRYWELFRALNVLNEEAQSIDKPLMAAYCKVQSLVQMSLVYHFDPNDFHKVGDIDSDLLLAYWSRLTIIFENFGKGTFSEEIFSDELTPIY